MGLIKAENDIVKYADVLILISLLTWNAINIIPKLHNFFLVEITISFYLSCCSNVLLLHVSQHIH